MSELTAKGIADDMYSTLISTWNWKEADEVKSIAANKIEGFAAA